MMIPHRSYFFILVFSVLQILASSTLRYCRHDQRDALMEFKHEFPTNESNSSPYGASLRSWNESSDCCFWKGVTCDAKFGEVISLDLSYISLNNYLKPNSGLFKLQHLRNLTLAGCGLYGEIPSSLGNLSRLILLDLSSNNLVGEIPASIGIITQLRVLSLSGNSFNGSIPVSLANLTKISTVDISYNQFKSTLPFNMSGFHNLEDFDVSGNSFFGPFPKSLFTIPSLSYVSLWMNQLKGPIEFGNMSFVSSSLRDLDLSFNKFDGPFPTSISEFLNLKHLDLSGNNFTGSIPKSISKLVNLKTLSLSYNNFIGPIPTSISKLVFLESLDLSNNKLQGQVPGFLWRVRMLLLSHNFLSSFGKSSEVPNIHALDLSSNSFYEPSPHWICKHRSLKSLDLSNNSFSGSIPQCLKDSIANLKELSMHNNNFSGTLPDIFDNATSLMSINLSGNQLEGKLPKSLIKCKDLKYLNVQRNRIKDKFPSWLGTLPSLNVLILRSNQFYGQLHTSIGFQSLKVVDISHNDFTGALPPFIFAYWREMATLTPKDGHSTYMYERAVDVGIIFSMEMMHKGVEMDFELINTDFKAIDFSGNKFHGNIPETIGLLKGLLHLNLSGNAFTSKIPPSLADLTNLETLDLSRNQLSGQIPQDLGSLTFLSTMNFSHNSLEGPIPRGTQFQRQKCSSFMDNPKLHGLEDICEQTHVPNPAPQETEDSMLEPKEQVISWIVAAIAYGPGVFCGLVIGRIFASHKHEWFMEKFGRNKPRAAI